MGSFPTPPNLQSNKPPAQDIRPLAAPLINSSDPLQHATGESLQTLQEYCDALASSELNILTFLNNIAIQGEWFPNIGVGGSPQNALIRLDVIAGVPELVILSPNNQSFLFLGNSGIPEIQLSDPTGVAFAVLSPQQLSLINLSGLGTLIDIDAGGFAGQPIVRVGASSGTAKAELTESLLTFTSPTGVLLAEIDPANGFVVINPANGHVSFISLNSLVINNITRIDASGNVISANGDSGTITYVKTVNFGGSSVTTGTLTFANGIVTGHT